ncbi:MAG: hypothetical protein AB8G26_14400 [Ilumatobacter sp.]
MIVTVSSVSGAPGATSWAVLLAAAWPTGSFVDRVVVETDLDGAVMGARFGIGVEPGASTLVASARHAAGAPLDLRDFGRRVDDQVWLVPGPESSESAAQLWGTPSASDDVATAAALDDRIWICDVGRAAVTGPMRPFFDRSAMAVVVTRAEHESLVQIPARVAALRRTGTRVGVLVVGSPTFSHTELTGFFEADQTWTANADLELVAASRNVWSQRRVRRSQLWRAAVAVAADLADAVAAKRDDNDPEDRDGR